ncbi:hypothetical protein LJR034_000346 [Caballeronia sp. LjRoot34]
MEQADIPVRRHRRKEFHQRARAFGEFEAQQAFVLRERRMAAHHVADMLLRQLVVAEIDRSKSVFDKRVRHLHRFAARLDLHADEDMGGVGIGDAVVEFCDAACTDQLAEPLETAAFFRNGHREHRFARFADFSALGDKTHPVEVHVCAGRDGDQRLRFQPIALRV